MTLRNFRLLGLPVFILLLISSCSYKNKNILFKTPKKLKSKEPVAVFGQTSKDTTVYRHRIKPGDRLLIRFLNNYDIGQAAIQSATSQANREAGVDKGYLVNYDSTVTLPLIGRTNLVGLTRLEASKNLENLYATWGIINPIIDLNIASLSVTILGEVMVPGKIQVDKENTTLVDIIALAGGLRDGAKKGNIKIIRNNQIILVDLKRIEPINSPEIIIQDNDIIYVEPHGVKVALEPIIAVTGGLTLLLTLTQVALFSVQFFYTTR